MKMSSKMLSHMLHAGVICNESAMNEQQIAVGNVVESGQRSELFCHSLCIFCVTAHLTFGTRPFIALSMWALPCIAPL